MIVMIMMMTTLVIVMMLMKIFCGLAVLQSGRSRSHEIANITLMIFIMMVMTMMMILIMTMMTLMMIIMTMIMMMIKIFCGLAVLQSGRRGQSHEIARGKSAENQCQRYQLMRHGGDDYDDEPHHDNDDDDDVKAS